MWVGSILVGLAIHKPEFKAHLQYSTFLSRGWQKCFRPKNDRAHQKIKLFAGCVWRVEVPNGSVLVPKPIFDGKLLMTSLPHLKNLHFWVSFREHKEPRGLGKGVAT